jgi:ketosteroid isomerase-like protein
MKKSHFIIPLAILLCFSFSCQKQNKETAPPVNIEAEEAKIKEVLHQYAMAWKDEDMDMFSKTFSHDDDLVVFDGNIAARFVDWEAWRDRLQEHLESYENVDISSRDLLIKVHASGDVAWLSCLLDADFLYQGQKGEMKGLRATWILENRQGSWIIVQAHFSLVDDR